MHTTVFPDLGTRQHCRDNVTMFSGKLLHLDTEGEALIFFFFLVPDA